MSNLKIPFLTLNLMRFNKGRVVREIDMRYELSNIEAVPEEILEFFESDFAIEYHKVLTDAGLDIKYEFTHEQWGKTHKRMSLYDGDNLQQVINVGGFNSNMQDFAVEIIGKFGVYMLNKKLKEELKSGEVATVRIKI